MDFQQILDWGYTFYAQYPIFCYILLGVVVLLTLWKPAKVLKTSLLLLVLLVVLYICFFLIGSLNVGMDAKNRAAHKTEKALE